MPSYCRHQTGSPGEVALVPVMNGHIVSLVSGELPVHLGPGLTCKALMEAQ